MNVKIEKRGKEDFLIIEAPIKEAISKSGKSLLLVSSNGNLTTSAVHKGKPVVVGLNAYVRHDSK
jgi:hypothetical protein